MAHDFGIKRKNERYKYFFGYANGMMYEAFNHMECNYGLSGSGSCFTIDKDTAIRGLERAHEIFISINYPDPTRFDDLLEFLETIKNDPEDTEYIISYT